jgi:hypothetical protein
VGNRLRQYLAVGNNADLYEAVFAAAGLRYLRLPEAFVALDPPPPYYSNLVVLRENSTAKVAAHLAQWANLRPGPSVFKDSFCDIDLSAHGFAPMHTASWIWHPGTRFPAAKGWVKVDNGKDLARWRDGWKAGGSPTPDQVFHDSLLRNRGIAFFAKWQDHAVTTGCLANKSVDCVGLSNLFGPGDITALYEDALAAVAGFGPGSPIVGFEGGESLVAAKMAGFQPVGDLRIQAANEPKF